jgi:hypothetical protein
MRRVTYLRGLQRVAQPVQLPIARLDLDAQRADSRRHGLQHALRLAVHRCPRAPDTWPPVAALEATAAAIVIVIVVVAVTDARSVIGSLFALPLDTAHGTQPRLATALRRRKLR